MGVQSPAPTTMTIGVMARRLGVNPRALRFYERIGLLTPSARTAAGYRLYDEHDAERVSFIRAAQAFGLSLNDIGGILAVRDGGAAPCRKVRALAEAHIAALDAQLAQIVALRSELARLATAAAEVEPACGASDGICLAFSAPS